jgi:hypothetical protein
LAAVLLLGIGGLVIQPRAPVLAKTSVFMLPRYEKKGSLELIGIGQPASELATGDVRVRDVAIGLLELIYIAGVAAMALRLATGFVGIAVRIRRARPYRSKAGFEVLIDGSAPSPSTAWCGRYVILLPSAAAYWPDDLTEIVIQHEREHVARGDWWWNLCGLAACSVAWVNPLVWILHRSCRDLSELAVDDSVLRSGTPASTYAQHLLQVASQVKTRGEGLAPAMAATPKISRRIEILMKQHQRRGAASIAVIASMAGVQATLLTLLSAWSFVQVDPFRIALTPAPPTTHLSEQWYVLEGPVPGVAADQAGARAIDGDKLAKMLRDGHALAVGSARRTLTDATALPTMALIEPKDVIFGRKVSLTSTQADFEYKEAVFIRPGLLEFRLQAGQAGAKSYVVYESTLSEGPGTAWVRKERQAICMFAPASGNHRLLIVHEFK